MKNAATLRREMSDALMQGIITRWYPLVLDREQGGYYTNVSNDWKLEPQQEKMIVSQARHVWTLSKIAGFTGNRKEYLDQAMHGFEFLRAKMWDQRFGGFFQIRSRNGGGTDVRGWRDEKRAYGNAFGVYALAALYERTGDPAVLNFAQTAFRWIEKHSFDPVYGGYFQFLTREGQPFDNRSEYKTIASDANEVGFKDQNASIHLLEAYTELLRVWNEPHLKTQLHALLELIRDTMTDERGYLRLFFQYDWTPVSFRDCSAEDREADFGLDHVSFGHDYETAFLMLEASHALGLQYDTRTLTVARRMMDHAIANGWDRDAGGFYDGGYYFKGGNQCSIVRDTKNWWAQAEALNALLLFSKIFPEDPRYEDLFLRQWNYVKTSILDPVNGDWFEGGIDKEPHFRTGAKSHMWKCTYHTGRALMNCIAMLSDDVADQPGIVQHKAELDSLIDHWKHVKQ